MEKEYRCAIIGQHPMRFPWGFDEEDTQCRRMKLELAQCIMELRQCGVTEFQVACDPGVGLYAGEIVNITKQNDEAMRLVCVTACFCADSKVFAVSAIFLERGETETMSRSIGKCFFLAGLGKLVSARSLMCGICSERILSGMALPPLSECKACAVLIRRRDTARFCSACHRAALRPRSSMNTLCPCRCGSAATVTCVSVCAPI